MMTEAPQTPPPLTDYPILTDDNDKPWSHKGRFGRLSYLAWSLVTALIFMVVVGVCFTVLISNGLFSHGAGHILENLGIGPIIGGAILYLIFIYFGIIFGIRRLHDVDRTGWWLVLPQLATVNQFFKFLHIGHSPIISGILTLLSIIFWLYLIFARGTDGSNRFGLQRTTLQWEKVTGWIYIVLVPTIFILAIIAAIAIPAYQKAHAAQNFSQPNSLTIDAAPIATAHSASPATPIQ